MKYSILIIFFSVGFKDLCAQNSIQLNTPFYWLKDASSKAASKDSSGTFLSLKKAVNAGLYDVQVISNNIKYNTILSTSQKKRN